MKKLTELSIGIIAAVSVIILAGCSISVDNGDVPTGTQNPVPTKAEATPQAEPTITITPTETPVPTVTQAPINNNTESGEASMIEISNNYMKKIQITEECPEAVCEKKADVAYGTVVHKTYESKTTGLTRGVNIVLPPNYDESKKYPVLYLLHGIFGNEYSLINDNNNKIVEISGNLAAEGKAKEMIIVLPDMFATTDKNQQVGFNLESTAAYDNFINDLTNDLMPFIEENYSILTDRENQAISGFSMGGREALYIGFTRPDLFGYVIGIAPAPGLTPGKDWAMSHPGQMQEDELKIKNSDETPYLIMVCCGTKDGVVGTFPKSYHNILEKNEVNHLWYEVPGADHDSNAIRSGLYNFISSIFKAEE